MTKCKACKRKECVCAAEAEALEKLIQEQKWTMPETNGAKGVRAIGLKYPNSRKSKEGIRRFNTKKPRGGRDVGPSWSPK